LQPKRIVVVGGTGVVADSVARSLAAFTAGSVARAAGADRYATSAAVSRSTFGAGVAVAYIATGQNFPDALGAGAAAGGRGPVLLVTRTGIPGPTADELRRLQPKRIVVVGGTGVVADSVARSLAGMAPMPTTGIYISPNGSDSAAGTLSAPMRSIRAASARLSPGQTLWVRGGTYTNQGGYNWLSSGTATAPVAIRAYPGEVPTFDGRGQSHGIIISGRSHVVVDGLKFTGFGMGPTGDASILLINARGITIRNNTILNSGSGFQQDHHIYINSGCSDITISNNVMDTTPGAAVHIYHDTGPSRVLVDNNVMKRGYWGVVVGSNAIAVTVTGNSFSSNVVDIDNQRGTNVVASGNEPGDAIR
jgi:hypothetical protein